MAEGRWSDEDGQKAGVTSGHAGPMKTVGMKRVEVHGWEVQCVSRRRRGGPQDMRPGPREGGRPLTLRPPVVAGDRDGRPGVPFSRYCPVAIGSGR